MSRHHSRAHVALALVLLLTWGAGLWLRTFATGLPESLSGSVSAQDYSIAALVTAAYGVGLAGLGTLVIVAFRAPRRLLHWTLGGATVLLVVAAATWAYSTTATPAEAEMTTRPADALLFALVVPTSWPLLGLSLAALVRLVVPRGDHDVPGRGRTGAITHLD